MTDIVKKTIIKEVSSYYDLKPQLMFSKTRKRDITQPRQLTQYLIFKYTRLSLDMIGKISLEYGRETQHNHASILHAIKEVENRLQTNLDFFDDFNHIVKVLNSILDLEKYPVFNIKNIFKKTTVKDSQEADLLKENKKLKTQLANIGKYKEINDLLALDEEQILFFIQYKLKPHLRMLEVKQTVKTN